MTKAKSILWFFCQVWILPMTVYAAACWNKFEFSSIHSHASEFIANFLGALAVPQDIGFQIGSVLTFIPAALANLAPSGSELLLFPAMLVNDIDMTFAVLVVFFLTTRMPQFKRAHKVAVTA